MFLTFQSVGVGEKIEKRKGIDQYWVLPFLLFWF